MSEQINQEELSNQIDENINESNTLEFNNVENSNLNHNQDEIILQNQEQNNVPQLLIINRENNDEKLNSIDQNVQENQESEDFHSFISKEDEKLINNIENEIENKIESKIENEIENKIENEIKNSLAEENEIHSVDLNSDKLEDLDGSILQTDSNKNSFYEDLYVDNTEDVENTEDNVQKININNEDQIHSEYDAVVDDSNAVSTTNKDKFDNLDQMNSVAQNVSIESNVDREANILNNEQLQQEINEIAENSQIQNDQILEIENAQKEDHENNIIQCKEQDKSTINEIQDNDEQQIISQINIPIEIQEEYAIESKVDEEIHNENLNNEQPNANFVEVDLENIEASNVNDIDQTNDENDLNQIINNIDKAFNEINNEQNILNDPINENDGSSSEDENHNDTLNNLHLEEEIGENDESKEDIIESKEANIEMPSKNQVEDNLLIENNNEEEIISKPIVIPQLNINSIQVPSEENIEMAISNDSDESISDSTYSNYINSSVITFDEGYFSPSGSHTRFSSFPNLPTQTFDSKIKINSETSTKLSDYVHYFYTYRPASSTVYSLIHSQEMKDIIAREIFDILDVYVHKIIEFREYILEVLNKDLIDLIENSYSNAFIIYSNVYFTNSIKIFDSLFKISLIISSKNSLALDFNLYKRAYAQMKKDDLTDEKKKEIEMLSEFSPLYQFLAVRNSIQNLIFESTKLYREKLDDHLVRMIQFCTNKLIEHDFIIPDEKFQLLRALVFSLSLISEKVGQDQFNVQDTVKILKSNPFIPIYGDMTCSISNVLSKVSILPKLNLDSKEETWIEKNILIGSMIPEFDNEYLKFLSDFARIEIQIAYLQKEDSRSLHELPRALKSQVTEFVKSGLSLMTKSKIKIVEQVTWKWSHPCSMERVKENVNDKLYELIESGTKESQENEEVQSINFDRVMRFNYTYEERGHLLRLISILKNVSNILNSCNSKFMRIIRSDIYSQIQLFSRSTLSDHIYRVRAEKKKVPILDFVITLQNLLADGPCITPSRRGKTTPPEAVTLKDNHSSIPSPQQIEATEEILSILINPKRPGWKKKLFKKKDFSKRQKQELIDFYNNFKWFKYLIDLPKTTQIIGDLSELYFKELNYEISKRVWFPVKSSLGYMLIKAATKKCDRNVSDILNILHIYQDAAYSSLFIVKRRHLFDEVKAELQLCVEYLSFKLSESIYLYFKQEATQYILSQYPPQIEKFQKQKGKSKNNQSSTSTTNSTETATYNDFSKLMRIRDFPLLDSSLDLNGILSSRVTDLIINNLKIAIHNFESGPLTQIHEFELMLNSIKITRDLLSKHLTIPEFEHLLVLADDRSSLHSTDGRIIMHIISEVCLVMSQEMTFDLTTHRFFNAEILACKSLSSYERLNSLPLNDMFSFGSTTLNDSIKKIVEPNTKYFGSEHIQCLQRICGDSLWPQLCDSAFDFLNDRISNEIFKIVEELIRVLSSLPLIPYFSRLNLLLSNVDTTFKEFKNYEGLPDIFHCFRLIGNVLLFVLLADISLKSSDILNKYSTSSILRHAKYIKENMPQTQSQTQTQSLSQSLIQSQQSIFFTSNFVQDFKKLLQSNSFSSDYESLLIDALQSSQRKQSTSMLSYLLNKIHQETLISPFKDLLCGKIYSNSNEAKREASFSRLWSVLEYIFYRKSYVVTIDNTERQLKYHSIFGDGPLFFSQSLIHLLNQRFQFQSLSILNQAFNLWNHQGGQGNQNNHGKLALDPGHRETMEHFFFGELRYQQIFRLLNEAYTVQYEIKELSPPKSLKKSPIPESQYHSIKSNLPPANYVSPSFSFTLSIDSPQIVGSILEMSTITTDSLNSEEGSINMNLKLDEDLDSSLVDSLDRSIAHNIEN